MMPTNIKHLNQTDSMKKTADFLFEAGMLKQLKRSGWLTINIPECESVADHSFRTAVIGYVLARMENLSEKDELLLIKACLFHDLHETRIGDINKLNIHYVKADEKKAEKDILRGLPFEKDLLSSLSPKSKISILTKDADKLEIILQAKEYVEAGNENAKEWIKNAKKLVKSDSGKKLLEMILNTCSKDWLFSAKGIK